VRTPLDRLTDMWIAIATALTIIALAVALFLNPVWVAFEQGRADAAARTGFSEPDLRAATNAILAGLVGASDFDVEVAGAPVLDGRERAHMRDVRNVFFGFFAIAAVVAVVGIVIARRRPPERRRATWRAVRGGATWLVEALVVLGIVAIVAFDTLFDLFHRLLFPSGSFDFDPQTERLVQLFPFQFWQETAIAVGCVAIVAALVVVMVARGRLATLRAAGPAPVALERSSP
jgi:integral membrane protein (TIGR01906 family)